MNETDMEDRRNLAATFRKIANDLENEQSSVRNEQIDSDDADAHLRWEINDFYLDMKFSKIQKSVGDMNALRDKLTETEPKNEKLNKKPKRGKKT